MSVNKKSDEEVNKDGDSSIVISFYTRQNVNKKLEEIAKRESKKKNALLREAVDDFINKTNSEKYYSLNVNGVNLTVNTLSKIIGSGVDAGDAFLCFVSWLEGRGSLKVGVGKEGNDLLSDLISMLKKKGKYNDFLDVSYNLINELGLIFYNEKILHLNAYKIIRSVIRDKNRIDEKEGLIAAVNQFIDMEYDIMWNIISHSEDMKFLVLFFFREGLFENRRYLVPQWIETSREAVVAMNIPWTEKATDPSGE